jgi:putative endonuclease
MDRQYFVYIMASRRNGTLYVGMTNNLLRRVWEHREGLIEGFTSEYRVKHLVYFETFEDVHAAIHRETRLKKWKRQWKIDLIQRENVEWDDLYEKMTAPQPLPEWLVEANRIAAARVP